MVIYWAVIGKDERVDELYESEKEAKENYYRYRGGKGYPFHIGRVSVRELSKEEKRRD